MRLMLHERASLIQKLSVLRLHTVVSCFFHQCLWPVRWDCVHAYPAFYKRVKCGKGDDAFAVVALRMQGM